MRPSPAATAPLLTPEFQLLLTCVRWPKDASLAAMTRDQAALVTDWPRFMALVQRHRVSGLTHHALVTSGVAPPPRIAAALAAQSRDSAVHEVSSVGETIQLVRRLRAAGVDAAVLKGATVALLAFGRFGVRYSVDIDLMVDRADVGAASSVLRQLGYVRTEPPETVSDGKMSARMRRNKDLAFENPAKGMKVELHWRLFQNPCLMGDVDMTSFRPSALTPGETVMALSMDIAPLYLLVHGAEHAWSRLKWLADAGALLRSETAMAERLYRQAKALGLARSVGPGILLSAELLGTSVPDELTDDLRRDWRMRWLLDTARDSLIGDQQGTELEDTPFATTRKNLGHYLASDDPRYWFCEARFDLLDEAPLGQAQQPLVSRVWRRARSLTGMLMGSRAVSR